jgi:hypothetical protein
MVDDFFKCQCPTDSTNMTVISPETVAGRAILQGEMRQMSMKFLAGWTGFRVSVSF